MKKIGFGLAVLPLLGLIFVGRIYALEPANPNASENARKVLNYLDSLPNESENRVISGQDAGEPWGYSSSYNQHITQVYEETGKWIALIGCDYAWADWSSAGQNDVLIDHWNNGGLITIQWHAYNPWSGDGLNWTGDQYYEGQVGDFADLYTSGNSAYNAWRADLDRKAEWLAELQQEGVVVLWRPLHEMNGDWFWWCNNDQTKYINLWRDMFDYFTYDKGLNNLLWVYAPNRAYSGIPKSAQYYYPGDDYVDIVGLDYYLDYPENSLAGIESQGYSQLVDKGKPFALTEFGPRGSSFNPSQNSYDYEKLVDEIQQYDLEVVYFLAWSGDFAIVNQLNADGLLNHSSIITRDEVNWQGIPEGSPTPTSPPGSNPYDLNQDGQITTADLAWLLQYYFKQPVYSAADFNVDALVNSFDFTALFQMI